MSHRLRSTSLSFALLLASSACSSDADTEVDDATSTGAQMGSTAAASTDPTGSVSTTSGGSTGSSTTDADTSTTTVADATGASSSDTGSDESSSSSGGSDTGSTTGTQDTLCPAFEDTFDGPLDPLWMSQWPGSIEQAGGLTVFSISAAPNDNYPRRLLSWADLGAAADTTVSVRMQPAAAPTLAGTQINLIIEGPPGSDVTFSLNRPGSLQYRLTTADGVETTVWAEQAADFPDQGWLALEIADGSATAMVLDSGGVVVETLAPVTIPFDVADAQIGFAANNWGKLGEDTTLAVETFGLTCE